MEHAVINSNLDTTRNHSCNTHIGTCGYSYTEWIDAGFYDSGTKNIDMLSQYACHFESVELNYTWYQMARADAIARLVSQAPINFRFAAKLTRSMTHERAGNLKELLAQFKEGIAPFGSQLTAILIQLPSDFDRGIDNRRYLGTLLDGLQNYPIAVEFRHPSWATDSVFIELERRKVTLVTVDVPNFAGLFPSLDVVTNPDLVYVRLHGRNEAGWAMDNMQKKFDYDYTSDELNYWCNNSLHPMLCKCKKALVFFNNHVRGRAAYNARNLAHILSHP